MNFFPKTKSENITRKEYSYSQETDKNEAVNLKFTLRCDVKKELKPFKELLLKALEDVEDDLKKLL